MSTTEFEKGMRSNFILLTTDFSQSYTEISSRLRRVNKNNFFLIIFPCYSVSFRGGCFNEE